MEVNLKKFKVKVVSVDFEFETGQGYNEVSENAERIASAQYNEAMQEAAAYLVEAFDSEDAHQQVVRLVQKDTGWNVRKVLTNISEVK